MDQAPALARFSTLYPSPSGPGVVTSRWIAAADFAEVRARPRLPGAVAAFAASLIDLYKGNILLNALLCDRGRVLLGLFLLYLDVLPLPGSSQRGATLGAVQALCRRTGLCSAGRAASILAAMRFGGYIAPQTDPGDHRRRILVPSPRLIAAHQRHWVLQFEAMAPVFPGAVRVPVQLQVPAYRTEFLRHLALYYFAGFRVVEHVPVLAGLAESNAGLLIMSSLGLPQLRGEYQTGATLPISISALSRQFCVSRAHVRNMLAVSGRLGLVEHAPGSDEVIPQPALAEGLIQFYAVLFMLFDQAATAAAAAALRDEPA